MNGFAFNQYVAGNWQLANNTNFSSPGTAPSPIPAQERSWLFSHSLCQMLKIRPEISVQPALVSQPLELWVQKSEKEKLEMVRKGRTLFERHTIKTKLPGKFFLIEDPKRIILVIMMTSNRKYNKNVIWKREKSVIQGRKK